MTSDNKCSLCDLPVCNDQCQMGHNHYIECQILRNFRNKIRGQQELKQMSILPIRILATCDTSKFTYAKSKLFHQELSNEGDYLCKKNIFTQKYYVFCMSKTVLKKRFHYSDCSTENLIILGTHGNYI